jgi:HAD superfamily hydrolase (TIGR01509 family)
MSGAPLVMLDIGSTLVRGPDRGPAKRIAAAVGMTRDERRALHRALMTRPFESPASVSAFARSELARSGPDVEAAIEDVWAAQEHDAEPIDGALEALSDLRTHGVRLALVSNIWQPFLTSVWRHFGTFFDAHVPEELQLFSFRLGVAKPDPEIFERALGAAGVAARDAVMVGDSYDDDIDPAASLGIGTVWVLDSPRKDGGVASIAEVDFELVCAAAGRSGEHAT